MDYSKMSDFEINCEVLAALEPDVNHMCLSESKEFFYDCGPAGDSWNQISIHDYCNNPADAWPIIVAELIALKPVALFVGGHRWFASKGEGDFGIKHADENPLRAAMIVFLMMQESANVPANPTGTDLR